MRSLSDFPVNVSWHVIGCAAIRPNQPFPLARETGCSDRSRTHRPGAGRDLVRIPWALIGQSPNKVGAIIGRREEERTEQNNETTTNSHSIESWLAL